MELLLQGGTALLPDGGATRCDVYISGDSIRSLDGAPADARGFRTLNCSGMVIVPGLVNAHTHAYMTALRCCGDDLPFDRWLFRRVMPLEERMTPEQAKYSTLLGCMEMLQGGVTAFLDMHMFPHAVAEAVDISGMKAVLSRGLSGGEDDPQGGARRIREALEEVDSRGTPASPACWVLTRPTPAARPISGRSPIWPGSGGCASTPIWPRARGRR